MIRPHRSSTLFPYPPLSRSSVAQFVRFLVTGGRGYLAPHVRRFFNAEDLPRRSHLDVLSPLDAARAGVYEVVIHLAAYSSKNPADADNCFRTNVEGTANLLREMQPNSVFIFASTRDVYGSHADRSEERRVGKE